MHQNRVHFPAERNAFVLDPQHVRRDVTCKPAIRGRQRNRMSSFVRCCLYYTLLFLTFEYRASRGFYIFFFILSFLFLVFSWLALRLLFGEKNFCLDPIPPRSLFLLSMRYKLTCNTWLSCDTRLSVKLHSCHKSREIQQKLNAHNNNKTNFINSFVAINILHIWITVKLVIFYWGNPVDGINVDHPITAKTLTNLNSKTFYRARNGLNFFICKLAKGQFIQYKL